MTTPDQSEGDRARDQVIAGEYVLGVLSLEERRNVEARLARDPAFAATVGRWAENLSSFDEDYDTVMPPADLYRRIEARLFPQRAGAGFVSLWSSVRLWRALTAASLIALIATVVIRNQPFGPDRPLVAQMTGEGNAISLMARYQADSGRLSVTPVAAGPGAQRSLEVWMIAGSDPAVSLGVLPQSGEGEIEVPEGMRSRIAEGITFAVSLEPYGGSPTGVATGPVVAAGQARLP